MRDRRNCDLFVDCDFQSLRARRDCRQSGYVTKTNARFIPSRRNKSTNRRMLSAAKFCAPSFRLSRKTGRAMILIFPMSILASRCKLF